MIRDAHCIFVMGDGLVLEQGTHDKLLHKEDGHYSRFAQAQVLCEEQEDIDDSGSNLPDKAIGVDYPIPQPSPKSPEPLRCRSTSHSGTSQTNEKGAQSTFEPDEIGLFEVFRQLTLLNCTAWGKYDFGIVAACCMYFFC
jgi:ATP-binding cassette subfamily B (MDR/TAP) protein 1